MSYIASLFSKSNARKYSFNSDDDENLGAESRSFLPEKQQIRQRPIFTLPVVISWLVSTLAIASMAVYWDRRTVISPLGTFETGWKTDFGTLS
jgi:hypothetical protein